MLKKIRRYLADNHLDALIVPHQDEFLGEYLTPDKERLFALTGFSGSEGLAVVTAEQSVLFVDPRYTIQAKIQSEFNVFEVPTDITPLKWIKQYLLNKKVAFCGKVHSAEQILRWQTECPEINWVSLNENVVDKFWANRPSAPFAQIISYDEYAGCSSQEKIKLVTDKMTEQGFDTLLLADPESVSWLLNRRDLQHTQAPIYYERAIVYKNGTCRLLSADIYPSLENKVVSDFSKLPYDMYEKLQSVLVNQPDIVAQIKSQKNKTEISYLKQACQFESAVICQFLAWIETNKSTITELDCVDKLHQLRSINHLYVADSFDVIAASGPHAAQAHYLPSVSSSCEIKKYPLLLIDTGGQYYNGTTDMTRTICIGMPTNIMKKRYTQVLKGHIALASSEIQEGDRPNEIDTLAHQFLRMDGVDYLHATGHGIGMFLSVHETPPIIHEKSKTPLLANMVFSNEPGYYDEQLGFGIRLENMLLSVLLPTGKLRFENLLYIPFDYRLTDVSILTDSEKQWLKQYHQKIKTNIFPLLDTDTQHVLKPMVDFFIGIC